MSRHDKCLPFGSPACLISCSLSQRWRPVGCKDEDKQLTHPAPCPDRNCRRMLNALMICKQSDGASFFVHKVTTATSQRVSFRENKTLLLDYIKILKKKKPKQKENKQTTSCFNLQPVPQVLILGGAPLQLPELSGSSSVAPLSARNIEAEGENGRRQRNRKAKPAAV